MAESGRSVPEWVTLTDGEQVRYRKHPSRIPYILQGVSAILLILVGGLIIMFGEGAVGDLSEALPVDIATIGIIFGAIGVLNIVYVYLSWLAREYLITTEEVYAKFGLVSGRLTIIPLDYTSIRLGDVKDVSVSQSFIERLFGYGEIVMQPPHDEELILENVVDPGTFNDTIERNRPENAPERRAAPEQ